jgi:hypothetical protein
MNTLQPAPPPWSICVQRRHAPAKAGGLHGYRKYRPCLRWDFAFSCGFCMAHEADLCHAGALGSGMFEVEHFHTQSAFPQLKNDFDNCFNACRYCNRARGSLEAETSDGRRLLNPCTDVWSDFFQRVGDELLPVPGDPNAAYTCETYQLNEPIKLKMRSLRRMTIEECVEVLRDGQTLHDELTSKWLEQRDELLIVAAQKLNESRRMAMRVLTSFAGIPEDAHVACRCDTVVHHCAPPIMAVITMNIPLR